MSPSLLYKLVEAGNDNHFFAIEVQKALDDGWSMYGPTMIHPDGYYAQAFVKDKK